MIVGESIFSDGGIELIYGGVEMIVWEAMVMCLLFFTVEYLYECVSVAVLIPCDAGYDGYCPAAVLVDEFEVPSFEIRMCFSPSLEPFGVEESPESVDKMGYHLLNIRNIIDSSSDRAGRAVFKFW